MLKLLNKEIVSKPYQVDTVIAKSQLCPSDILPSLVLAEQFENPNRHCWNVGD
jgi:hypothetical protein